MWELHLWYFTESIFIAFYWHFSTNIHFVKLLIYILFLLFFQRTYFNYYNILFCLLLHATLFWHCKLFSFLILLKFLKIIFFWISKVAENFKILQLVFLLLINCINMWSWIVWKTKCFSKFRASLFGYKLLLNLWFYLIFFIFLLMLHAS